MITGIYGKGPTMSVEVTIGFTSTDSETKPITEDHSAGTSFQVDAHGTLYVLDGGRSYVAAYAPGKWDSVVVKN